MRRLLGFVLLLAVAAAPLHADAQESYRQGLEAFESGNFPEAARHFTRAIAEDPEASGLLSGTLLRRYTPHYYLGLSLAETGRCREAIRALDESERQGKIRDRETEILHTTRERCRTLVRQIEAAAAEAAEVADSAAEAAFAIARLEESTPVLTPVWNEGDPSFAERQREAAGLLTEARNRIQRGVESLEADLIYQGSQLAEQARDRLEAIARDAEAKRDQLEPRVRAQIEELAELANQTDREIQFVRSRFSPLPKSLAEIVEVTEASTRVAERADESTSLDLLEQVERELRDSLRRLRGAVQAPPDELMDAATALFAGEYDRASELLAGKVYRDVRANEQLCVLRTAARFGALRSEGASEAELASAVREEVAACPAVPPARELPPRYFSPEFRRAWSARGELPASEASPPEKPE